MACYYGMLPSHPRPWWITLLQLQLLLVIVVVHYPAAVAGWNIALEITTQAGGACFGGEPFETQPVVTVYNKQGMLQSSFVGRMTVQIDDIETSSNVGKFEPVWKEGDSIIPTRDIDTFVSENVVGGQAIFTGLGINAARERYQLKFVLYDEHGLIMGTVIGDEFDVRVGVAHRLGIVTQPEMAFGGSVFGSQPVLALQDRGGNTVSNANEGTVAVVLQHSPIGIESTLRCTEAEDDENNGFNVPVKDGLADFRGLFINEAGMHYSLHFSISTDISLLEGSSEVISNDFSVGVGPASEIVLINDASEVSFISGGKAFTPQPRTEVRDAGGNVLVDDSSSAVRVSFFSNPSKGELYSPASSSGTTERLRRGVVQFRGLSIDKAGVGYRLTYEFLEYDHEEAELKETSLSVHGSYFNVEIGPPHQLSILQHSAGGWAGNQPFPTQPIVALLDAGGNIVIGDSTSTVTAHVTPSLAHNSRVIIDTSNDAVPIVSEVVFAQSIKDDERTVYGPGDVIRIDVIFSQEVALFQINDGGVLPQIMLNAINAGGPDTVYAELAPIQHGLLSRTLSFEYSVKTGHSQTSLDYQSSASLLSNDYSIEDAFGRSVNLDLPSIGSGLSLSASKILDISDDRPMAESITADLLTGEYGAGHEVNFIVTFNREVAVSGNPGLPLNIESTIVVVDTTTADTILPESYFHIIYKGEKSESIPWDASAVEVKDAVELMQSITGEVCISRASSPNSLSAGGFRWAIRFDNIGDEASQIQVADAGLAFSGAGGSLVTNLVTTNSMLSGWVPDNGDMSMCTARAAAYTNGSGTKSLEFNLKVLPGDAAVRLDISEAAGTELLFPTLDDSVTLLVNSPGTSPIQADPNVEGMSLPLDQTISIDTLSPSIVNITPQASTTPSGTYAVGDPLFFEVTFDKPVEVDVGFELQLNTGNGVARYISGSGTETLLLQYTVEEGDVASELDFRDSNSLIAQNTEGGRLPVAGRVRRDSLLPTTDANLDMSHIASVTDAHSIVIDGNRPQLLAVYFDINDEGESFARGDTLTILIQFSAPVVVNESSPPILGLLVGVNERWATYSSGSGSSTLKFSYQVVVGDSSMPLEFQHKRLCHQNRDCINTKGLVVRLSATLELDADLNTGFSDQGMSVAGSIETGVTIDTSLSPVTTIVSTTTSKAAGTYGVGEFVDIEVQFTDSIFLPGTLPSLRLNTGNSAPYYAGKRTDTLTFRYISAEADSTLQLDWDIDPATNTAFACTGTCRIENANGVEVDVIFHDPVSDSALVEIALNPSPPQIVSINTDKTKSLYCHPSCIYTVGEEIDVYVSFDRPVVVQGNEVYLTMDVGDGALNNRATYVPSRSTEYELVFLYTVGHGHSSDGNSLNYLCSEILCSLELGGATEIKGAASMPTLDVDLTLPPCSEQGISGDDLNPLVIDTGGQPHVIDVLSTTVNGKYLPGDTIAISVQFDRAVAVSGEPSITLEVGTAQAGIASYKHGSGSSVLTFEYSVGLDHMTLDLDYIDAHSLYLGFDGVNSGSIRQASTNPSIDANIELALPGSIGSLGSNAEIQIDSRQPFVLLISAVPGEYSTGDEVKIHVQFSRPVVISGMPVLNLEMGLTDRTAEYESQPNDQTLEFKFTVQLGDFTENLDYWSDEELLPSSSMSFNLNGASIKLKSTNPVLDADLHINPVDGFLDGGKIIEVTEGVALFQDLKIGQRGKDFKLWFKSNVPSTGVELQVAEAVKIETSIEYEVIGDLTNRDPGDLYGSAVSLHGDVLAVGAPGKLNPTPEVQVLTVYCEAAVEEHEVQIIATSVNRNEAVMSSQEFSTCADAGETISGSFTLTYNIDSVYAFASPVEFDSDVSEDQLKSVLENELKMDGLIATSKSIDPTCESYNSWTWSVTFLDSLERVGVLKTNGDLLIGDGAHISQSVPTRDVDVLRGSFQLVNPFNGLITRAISHNASSNAVKNAIQEDLDIEVLAVQAENTDPDNAIAELGRQWTIIFSHHIAEYGLDTNVPQLQAVPDGLFGNDCHVMTHTGFEGRSILSGSFALSFRGSNPSYFVSHDSSMEEIEAALESLHSINDVSVSDRRLFSNQVGKSGFSWTITFHSVNKQSDYGWLQSGWILDPVGASSNGNLPQITVTSHLIGWNTGYIVQAETGRGEEDTQAQWMTQRKGDDGSGSGSVDIFRNVRETWRREASVLASDYNSNDSFGASVSVVDDYVLVGAPSKEVDGLPEQQTLTCFGPASGGFFFVKFRGFTSHAIPFDATLIDIQHLVVGMYGGTDKIHSTRLLFTSGSNGWDGSSSGFCDGTETSFSVTFLTPDGGGISTVEKRSGDLEMLSVDTSELVGATVLIEEHRAGTVAPMGTDLNNSEPTGKQSGSAYLFQRHTSCSYCKPVWTQIMKFTPMDGLDNPMDAAEFGQSSVFVPGTDQTSSIVLLASPGFFHSSGKVYIFSVVQGSWLLLDILSDQNWNHERIKGGRFGSSLDADSDTILVGSPGHSNEKGAVYVFRRSDKGKPFLASQAIYGPDDLDEGSRFGHSVAIFKNRAVLCAPHTTVHAIHLSMRPPAPKQAGACYVYSREDKASAFKLDQQLIPSNILAGDRFGWSVAMISKRIVVGQVQKFTGKFKSPRPVQVIKSFCEQSPCKTASASTFRLRWIDAVRWTPYLTASTTANQMREAIESSLLSGAVTVSRSVLPDEDGGHTWRVTFDSYESIFRDVNNIPSIQCDAFVTSSLSCQTHVEHDIVHSQIRGKSHLFDFDEASQIWTEQAFLFSNAPQKQDLLATSVAIGGNFAVAGAPNRELLSVNSGAAIVYDISFLDYEFPDGPYSLKEGDILDINIERLSSEFRQVISLRTMDPNAEAEFQHYVNELFSTRSLDAISHDKTPVELVTANTAMGRSQYYGSHERRSLFVNGMYDIQGKNDYQLLNFEGQFKQGENEISTSLKTTDDSILESPDEHVSIQVNMRGMFASQLGRLKTDIHLLDNGDGVSPEGNMQYQVLDGHNHQELARMGTSIDVDRAAEMLIVGSDQSTGLDAHGSQLSNVGKASIFKRSTSGSWDFIEALTPPQGEVKANMMFGQSVAISKAYGRDDITVLVGAPGAAAVFVYAFQPSTSVWLLQSKLSANDATLSSEDRFGGRGAIALHEEMAYVGASKMEQVYVFRRSFVEGEGFASWDSYAILRSNDYDFDIYGHGFSINHIHQQGFGMALAASKRTLLVGAPRADYGNRGDVNMHEHFDTDGIHNGGLGKGKVYSFYSQPNVQIVTLRSDEKTQAGTFRLELSNHQGVIEDISGKIEHNSKPDLFKTSLEEMLTVGEVSVEVSEKIESNSFEISWRISFLSNFEDSHPVLIPKWRDNGCNHCDKFKVSVLSTVKPFITVTAIHSHQPYIQEGEGLQPRDVTSTDLFGASIAVDGPQAIIGSMHSAAKTRTTWDFETGDLQGWSATGTAFQFQPTFGDNSKMRANYEGYGNRASHSSGESMSSRLVGRYYIATFEKRSGNYQVPNQDFSLGSTQGDGPTGTLTSDPFIIGGDTISFLIGGGCNHLTAFIELLLDGYPSLRATGKCSERMDRVYWDTSLFRDRAGQIRIVDGGSRKWDHINVDEITFSWDRGQGSCQANNFGQCAEGGGALPKLSEKASEKQHYTGREESPMSGAAYMFLYECASMDLDDLSPSNSNCAWFEQERLVASDKREGNLFGVSVDVDHEQGVAIVGSSNAPAYGFYQEPIPVHPHTNVTIDLPIPESLEDIMKSGTTYSATGGNVRLIDYLIRKGQISVKESSKFTEQAGSIYVFLREPAKYGPGGEITKKPFWKTTEHGKIAPPDVAARDNFGISASLDGTSAAIGAIGRDGHEGNGGGAIVYDIEWVRVRFQKIEFRALESDRVVKIFVERDLSRSYARFSIGYSTSDLSAIGVDTLKFDECMNSISHHRDGCGDYEQTSGQVTFNEGEQHAYFNIRIMDDRCTEHHLEYVQLNLHQIGGSPLRGENYRSQLRIDDDDVLHHALSMNCTGEIY